MSIGRRTSLAIGLAVTSLACASLAHAEQPPAWDWSLEPYVWAAGLDTQVAAPAMGVSVEQELNFKDVSEILQGAFMVRMEGRGDHLGVQANFNYFGLGKTRLRNGLRTRTDVDARVLDLVATWRPGEERDRGVDFHVGMRYIDADVSAAAMPTAAGARPRGLDLDKQFADLLMGARVTLPLSHRWSASLQADASSGQTGGTWSASLLAQYRMAHGAWTVGYQHLDMKLGQNVVDAHVVLSGPQLGYSFSF